MAISSTQWRLLCHTPQSGGSSLAVAELDMHTTIGGADITTGGTISASYNNGSYPMGNAFDENAATFWLTASTEQWIQYTFTSPIVIVEISITARNDGYYRDTPASFEFQYYDGATWVSLLTKTGVTNWTNGLKQTFAVPNYSLSGNITETLAITDWRITATKCKDGSLSGTSISTGTTYSATCVDTDACTLTIAPKIDGQWKPSTYFPVNFLMCSATPDSHPHIWICTANSGDTNYATKKLLLHFDGTNGSTTFTDSSSNPKTFTVNGNAQLSTANKVFGTASYLGDGSGDYLSCAHNDFLFTNGNNHTVEFRFKCANNGTEYVAICQGAPSTAYYQVLIGGGTIRLNSNGANALSVAHTWDANWHHFAWCKVGSTNTIYIDGVSIGSWTNNDWSFLTNSLNIGGNVTAGGAGSWNGNIDELVIDTSVAYYTANFTPNTSAFANAQGTTGTSEPTLALSGDTVDGTTTWTYVAPLVNPISYSPRIPS